MRKQRILEGMSGYWKETTVTRTKQRLREGNNGY